MKLDSRPSDAIALALRADWSDIRRPGCDQASRNSIATEEKADPKGQQRRKSGPMLLATQ